MDTGKKDILECVAKAARGAYMKGFAAGSGDNASIRIRGQVYISPSGGCLEDLTAKDIVMLEVDGFVPSTDGPDYGGRWPSKEAEIHLTHYGSRPDILYLSHLHSPYSIAVACHRQEDRGSTMGVSAYTPGYVMRMGRILVIPYYRPGNGELAEAVSGVICRRDNPLLANHDMVTAGENPETALVAAEEIEENAHLAILLGNQEVPLDEEQTEALFQTGGKV